MAATIQRIQFGKKECKPSRGAAQNELLWSLMQNYRPDDKETIQKDIVRHVEYTLARTRLNFTNFHAFQATAHSVRDRLVERLNDTYTHFQSVGARRVYYLSLEFLVGRSLRNALHNMGLDKRYAQALSELGYRLENLYEEEKDAALGNGGLGRLAACFMDSLATLNIPATGYGLRYTYGMFEQKIHQGEQVEVPDSWLTNGNPWEIPRLDVQYPICFGGRVEASPRDDGTVHFEWVPTDKVIAVAYDTPIPGHDTQNTISIRLWASRPARQFDMDRFNQGDYMGAVSSRQASENLTCVLYPNDNTYSGKELRLKQEYLLVAATLADIVRRFKKTGLALKDLHTKVTIQLNDTHPALGIAELMRILVDLENMTWDEAWAVVTRVYNYTNHTVLPEALEKWPVSLMEALLPRHMHIIYEINSIFLKTVEKQWPNDTEAQGELSIIEEGYDKRVRMANLAIVGSAHVNGVAALHTEILKTKVFRLFYEMWPNKFQNKTNGVTPRRWVHQANPQLSSLITSMVGNEGWIDNYGEIAKIKQFANDKNIQEQWARIKHMNKMNLSAYVKKTLGIHIDATMLFDVQVKRIHEYKRQLMNILACIHYYHRLSELDNDDLARALPRAVFFGGKAAPGYFLAKRIIKLIHSVAEVVNKDPRISPYLKIVFIPNYNVRLAELIIPASDLSQHISTAGTEASGTSNMKFVMNGGLVVGTMDGANVEIVEETGIDNMFIFGLRADEVEKARHDTHACVTKSGDFRFQAVLASIEQGTFGNPQQFQPIVNSVRGSNDRYCLAADFPSYLTAMRQAERVYLDKTEWIRRCIVSTGSMGKFSSDNTVRQYAEEIWHVEPSVLDVCRI